MDVSILVHNLIRNCKDLNTKEVAICPFGANGLITKQILNWSYGIQESYIIDNGLSEYNKNIISVRDLKNIETENLVVIICTTNIKLNMQLSAEIDAVNKAIVVRNILPYELMVNGSSMGERRLFFEPWGGLCNRIAGIFSAYEFAKDINEKLTIIWMNNEECNCSIKELFDLPTDLDVINVPCIYDRRNNYVFQESLRKIIVSECDVFVSEEDFLRTHDLSEYVEETINVGQFDVLIDLFQLKGKKMYIDTCQPWYAVEKLGGRVSEMFVPTTELREIINNYCYRLDKNTVGVHIRRTDHTICREKATIKKFIKKMKEEVAVNPNVRFFCASDSLEEKRFLQDIFGKRVISNNDVPLGRDTKEAIKWAVIELFVLAGTTKIFGSFGSTYSWIASKIYDKPLVLIGDD